MNILRYNATTCDGHYLCREILGWWKVAEGEGRLGTTTPRAASPTGSRGHRAGRDPGGRRSDLGMLLLNAFEGMRGISGAKKLNARDLQMTGGEDPASSGERKSLLTEPARLGASPPPSFL